MTTGDIEPRIQYVYSISVSDSTVSRITDKIRPVAKEWRQRPLGDHLCDGIFSERYPLPCPQQGTNCEESGLYCHRHQSGWREGCTGHVGRRK
ncbi:MAG: transposase [Ruthenibacterium lactatiformans]